jgi:5-methylcytosine-specific restriction endonuclease McrA
MRTRKRDVLMRIKALDIVGNQCRGCGEQDRTVLTIDHIEGRDDGDNRSGTALRRAIVRGDVNLSSVQTLCANCHHRKSAGVDLELWADFLS